MHNDSDTVRPKTYLGDAVYATWDGYGVTLTTEDGIGVTNRIYLETPVLASLNHFLENMRELSKG